MAYNAPMEESIKVTVKGTISSVQANVGTNLSPYAKKEWVEKLIRDIGKEVFFFNSESEMEEAERNREWLYVVGDTIYRWTGLRFEQISGSGSLEKIMELIRDDTHVGDFSPTTQANTWLDTSVTLDMSEPSMAFEAPEEELAFEKVETELAFAEPTNENLSFSNDDPIDVTFEEVVETLSFGTEPEELVFGDN